MRLALVVMIDDLQAKIAAPLREGGPDVRYLRVPLPAELAVHQVVVFVVLQPLVRFEPVGPEPAALPADAGLGGRGRRRRRGGGGSPTFRALYHRTLLGDDAAARGGFGQFVRRCRYRRRRWRRRRWCYAILVRSPPLMFLSTEKERICV